jgi:hypothetical protein
MYRVLRAEGEVRERRRQATDPATIKPELLATGPNEIWSWGTSMAKPVALLLADLGVTFRKWQIQPDDRNAQDRDPSRGDRRRDG